jgi:asparagine synthase (glutamine-hydrolysing)
MCGIIGSISQSESNEKDWIEKGSEKMLHRGPDAKGYFKSRSGKVEFGQRRLSIIDLSAASDQPFVLIRDGFEYAITFNGEIYNFKELKKKLQSYGYSFITDSDTEVILISYLEWGNKCLDLFEGMFSFALYDGQFQKVLLARDIVGEKPFYYSIVDGNLIFASEFLALHSHIKFGNQISSDRIYEYLEMGYLPKNRSFCNEINKLPQGNYISFDIKTGNYIEESFFSIEKGNPDSPRKSKINDFDQILKDVINKEIRSDVSLGVMLSGGIDSSIIACKANESTRNITNFTVDFGDNEFEMENAKLISAEYGVKHEILEFNELTFNSFCDIINKIDEPIADTSFLPTFLITEKIKESGCTVVLGGDGADELFGGYSLYKNWLRLSRLSGLLPGYLKNTISNQVKNSKNNDTRIIKWLEKINYSDINFPNIREIFSREELEKIMGKSLNDYGQYYLNEINNNFTPIENLMHFDLYNYFSSNILLKNDRASMLNSIELRAPFLHKNIINFAWKEIPQSEKCNLFENKIFLKKYGKSIFPKNYNFHSKRGFNFNNSLSVNDKWKLFFDDSIVYLANKLNWDNSELNILRENISNDRFNFTKVYSLVALSNWIHSNNLNVK